MVPLVGGARRPSLVGNFPSNGSIVGIHGPSSRNVILQSVKQGQQSTQAAIINGASIYNDPNFNLVYAWVPMVPLQELDNTMINHFSRHNVTK